MPAKANKDAARLEDGAGATGASAATRQAAPFNRGLVLTAVALFAATALYLGLKVPIGIPGEWLRVYHEEYAPASSIVVFAGISCLFLLGAFLAERFAARAGALTRGALAAALAALYGGVLFASVAMGPAGRLEFIAPAVEWDACGLFGREAYRITSARQYLADFPRILGEYKADYRATVRVNNNPPGTTMMFYAARRLTMVSGAVADFSYGTIYGWGSMPPNDMMPGVILGAWLLLAGAALSFLPAYLVASRLLGRPAFFEAAVALLAISMLLFNPDNDTLQVMLFLWMTYFALRGASGRPLAWGAAFGLTAALAFFFTLATAVVVITLLAWAVVRSVSRARRQYLRDATFWAGAAAALAAGFGALYLTLHYDSLASLYACYVNHREFYAYFPRSYVKWALYNVCEFVMFFGGPLAAAVAWQAAAGQSQDGEALGNRQARLYIIATLAIIVALDLSGKNSSEVNRLWVFFMPLLALPALALTRRARSGAATLWAIGLLQIANVILVRFYVDIWRVEEFLREIGKYLPKSG